MRAKDLGGAQSTPVTGESDRASVPETTIVPCFVCGKWLDRVSVNTPMQPHGGVMCGASGNYGSRVLDNIFGTRLRFLICDECLVERRTRTRRVVDAHVRPEATYAEWIA